jgi:hypothetical protein
MCCRPIWVIEPARQSFLITPVFTLGNLGWVRPDLLDSLGDLLHVGL